MIILIHSLSYIKNPSEFGRNAQIISYTGNRVAIRKVDGAILFAATSSDIGLLYELTRAGRWEESLWYGIMKYNFYLFLSHYFQSWL